MNDENAGYISLGSASGVGAEFPPAGAAGRVVVVWDGGNKLQKAAAAGKDGAKITVQGTKVAEVTIEMSWPDRKPDRDAWETGIALISPYGANGSFAWDVSERFAVLYAAAAVIVEKFKGPVRKAGSDEMTMHVTCSAWTKPTNSGAGAGTTPSAPVPFSPAALPPLFAARGAAKDADGNPILPSTPTVVP